MVYLPLKICISWPVFIFPCPSVHWDDRHTNSRTASAAVDWELTWTITFHHLSTCFVWIQTGIYASVSCILTKNPKPQTIGSSKAVEILWQEIISLSKPASMCLQQIQFWLMNAFQKETIRKCLPSWSNFWFQISDQDITCNWLFRTKS